MKKGRELCGVTKLEHLQAYMQGPSFSGGVFKNLRGQKSGVIHRGKAGEILSLFFLWQPKV